MLKGIYEKCIEHMARFVLLNILLLTVYACQILIPYAFSGFIDQINRGLNLSVFNIFLVIISIATLVLLIALYYKGILSSQLNEIVNNNFLNQVDRKMEAIPLCKTKSYEPAYLNNRIFNDIITSVSFSIDTLIPASIMFVSTCVLFFLVAKTNALMLAVISVSLLINMCGLVILNKQMYKKGYLYRDANNSYLAANHNRLATIKETKIHAWFNVAGKQVDLAYHNAYQKKNHLVKILSLLENIGVMVKNITLILVMIVGGHLLLVKELSIGQLLLITTYTNMCLDYSDQFLKLGQGYQHAKICYSRLEEFLKEEDEVNGIEMIENIHTIQITDLSFSYPDAVPLYSKFNMTLEKGKIYCLQGKNGAGKSTLIDIILGVNYNYKGTVSYNQKDIRNIDMINARASNIAVMLQAPNLQNVSIMENITKGLENYSMERLNRLCSCLLLIG